MMFEGLDKIQWAQIRIRHWNLSESSPLEIPILLANLLADERSIRLQAIAKLDELLVEKDQLAYFTEAAPLAMPFLLEVLQLEDYPHKAEILNIINVGLMAYEEFELYSEPQSNAFNEIQIATHICLCEHQAIFLTLSKHENPEIAHSAMTILSLMPQEALRSLPMLLNHLEANEHDLHSGWLVRLQIMITYRKPSQADLQRYLALLNREFQKGLIGFNSANRYTHPVYDIAKKIVQASPADINPQIIEFFQAYFMDAPYKPLITNTYAEQRTMKLKSQRLFDAFLVLLDLFEARHLNYQNILAPLMNLLASASHNGQVVLLKALELKLSPIHLAELNQALWTKLRVEPNLMNEILLAKRKDELRLNKPKISDDDDLKRAYSLSLRDYQDKHRQDIQIVESQVDEPSSLEHLQNLGNQILRFLGLGE